MYSTIIYAGSILFCVSVATVTYFAFQPAIKGWIGERKVNKALKSMNKKNLGKNIKDITLLSKDGFSSQIDHIFINRSGIFVIETKNYSGEISGNEYDTKWKQHIGNKEFPIHNFSKQNYNHIKALRPLLSQYSNLPIYSFLSFNPDCKLNLNLTRTIATKYNTLINAIKIRSRIPVLTEQQVDEIYKLLKSEKSKNRTIAKTHTSRVNLQIEADAHAKSMNMSRKEYNDMLVEKYKNSAMSIDSHNTFDSMVDTASSRYAENLSDKNNNQPLHFNPNIRD